MATDLVEGGNLDVFSRILPLPYRLSLLIVAGVWLWGLNLHGFWLLKLDIAHLIRYTSRPGSAGDGARVQIPHYRSTYHFAAILSAPLGATLLLFWALTQGHPVKVQKWAIIPNVYFLFLLLAFVIPVRHLPRAGRLRFLHTLRRVSIGGLAKQDDGKFGDVLLADALTSYAKPLSEVFVAACMFVTGHSTTSKPNRSCGGSFMVPLVMCIPFLIRFRQCIIDRQRANAVKYATAFPAIALSAVQRDADSVGVSRGVLFYLWFLAVMVNSLYSFYWDVARDWDLTLFSSDRNEPTFPFGLRRTRVFDNPMVYYTAILVDLILRCTWSIKLSVHLEYFNDIEGGIFLLELLEVVRRWGWVFFRVEAEWIRSRASGDILLDDIGPKVDDE